MDYQIQIVFQLILAVIFGAIIGVERERKRKGAGLQTYSLVSLGSCLFAIIGLESINLFAENLGIKLDPLRIITAVATGIGFIGAGVVIFRQDHVEGITTAAGLWCAAAIGVAIGFKLYLLASVTVILTVIILSAFGAAERKFFKNR